MRLLQRDGPRHYGSEVWLVESFIDRPRFSGASYRAANWVPIGWTRGFAKRQGVFVHHGNKKEVYVYVMEKGMRRKVHGDVQQPLLTRSFLLAQRAVERKKTFARRERMKEMEKKWAAQLPPTWELKSEDVEKTGEELSEFVGLFGEAFGRVETRELCELYLQGLLSNTQRKNVEAMALELRGPEAVRSLQRFVSEYQCDEEVLRKRHWQELGASLADAQGVWSVDASEFPKKGQESVGVAPQYCGNLGKTANCPSGVFLAYVSPKGHALVESRLYLPECWFEAEYQERREQCRIPEEVKFQTKPELAGAILQSALQSGHFPARWVTCDTSFGNNEAFLAGLPSDLLYLAEIAWHPSSVASRSLRASKTRVRGQHGGGTDEGQGLVEVGNGPHLRRGKRAHRGGGRTHPGGSECATNPRQSTVALLAQRSQSEDQVRPEQCTSILPQERKGRRERGALAD